MTDPIGRAELPVEPLAEGQVAKLAGLLREVGEGRDRDPVALYGILERLAAVAAECQAGMLKEVNARVAAAFGSGQREIEAGGCLFRTYTQRATWVYPDELVKLAAKLTGMQKEAQENGQATKQRKVVNPVSDKQFSVAVLGDGSYSSK